MTLASHVLKLKPELVPEALWGLSAYRLLSGPEWTKIRRTVLTGQEKQCSVCGIKRDKGMFCHEVWNYQDQNGLAVLTGFAILCPKCNLVHHLGLAGALGLAEVALEHMAAVNAISAEEVDAIVRQAICHWKFRSQQSWKLAVDPDLLSRFPELAVVESRVASPREGARRLVFGKEPHDPRF